MKPLAIYLLFIILFALPCSAAPPGTMRLDYFHTGGMDQEIFSVDRVVIEPLPWPGNPNRLTDPTNRGTYFFDVRDLASKRLLYSRGFSSIYGEWITTDEAKRAHRTFHESLRFPAPESPVEIAVLKRDAKNVFREIWTTTIDPKDKQIDTSAPVFHPHVIAIERNGDPAQKTRSAFLR